MQNNYLLEYCVLERIALTLFNKSLLLKWVFFCWRSSFFPVPVWLAIIDIVRVCQSNIVLLDSVHCLLPYCSYMIRECRNFWHRYTGRCSCTRLNLSVFYTCLHTQTCL
jgi:hypothetical protein